MAVAGMSLGRDNSIVIMTQVGSLDLGFVESFKSKAGFTKIKKKGMDGTIRVGSLPDEGWSGEISAERTNQRIDAFFAKLEADYASGVNMPIISIQQTVKEPAGGISQYLFDGVALEYDDAGEWKGSDTAKIKISFMASRRRKVV